jgi:hypothetical protein
MKLSLNHLTLFTLQIGLLSGFLIMAQGTASATSAGKRTPSGMAVAQPALRLELSARDNSDPQWNCGSCTKGIRAPANKESIVTRMARYDSLFESVIDSATHHDAYKLRYKLYF